MLISPRITILLQLYSKYPDMDMEVLINATKPPTVEILPSGANFTAPAATYFYVLTKNGSQTSPVFVFSIGVVSSLKLCYCRI